MATSEPLTAAANADDPSSTAQDKTDDSARPDSVSAAVTARASGHRIEDLSQRTERTRTYANPDGTWTEESYEEPTAVQDEAGEWHDIDTTLVEQDGVIAPAYSAADLSLSTGGDKTFATLDESGKTLDWRWPTVLPKPTIEGNTATYPDAVPGGGDLVVTATPTGFTHDIVLEHAPDAAVAGQDPSWTIPVATDGAALGTVADGGLAITTDAGKSLATAPPPVMYDATAATAASTGEATTSGAVVDPPTGAVVPVEATVGETGSGTPAMTLSADASFLTDPDTVYPVTIDPTFTVNDSSDTYVDSSEPDATHASEIHLLAGYDGARKTRSFLKFDRPAIDDLAGKNVLSATFKLRNYSSLSCAGSAIRTSRVTDDWGNITWNTQPTITSDGSDDYTPAHGGPTCDVGWASWDITDIVAYWAAHPAANHGVRVKALDETTKASWRQYRSVNNGDDNVDPELTVTYSPPPNKPTSLFAVDGQQLSALVSNDGVTVTFAISSASGATKTVTSSEVDSGQRATATIPAGLASGRYTVSATTNDGYLDSTSAATTTLVVDPSAVALSDAKAVATHVVQSGADAMTGNVVSPTAQTDEATTALEDDADIPAPIALSEASAAQSGTSDHLNYVEDLADTYTESGLEIDDSGVDVSITSATIPTATSATINLTATYNQTIEDVAPGSGDKYVTAFGALESVNPEPTADDEDNTSTFEDTYVADFALVPHDVTSPSGAEVVAYYIPTLDTLAQAAPTDGAEGDDDSAPAGEEPGATEIEPTDSDTATASSATSGSSYQTTETVGNISGDVAQDGETLSTSDLGDPLIDDTSEASGQPLTAVQVDGPVTSTKPPSDGDSISTDPGGGGSTASYNRKAAAKYALYWTNKAHKNKMNSNYPSFRDNCANLVSQSLRAGGWALDGHIDDLPQNLTIWHYNLPGPFGATYTWGGAKYLLSYAHKQKHLNVLTHLEDLVPGDLMFFDWYSNGSVNHAMIVTGRTKKGLPMLSGKTNNRHNVPWKTFAKIANNHYGSFLAYGLSHLVAP